jgi:hypothetical protein
MTVLKPSSSPAFGSVITALLAIAGIEAWLTLGRGQWGRDYQPEVTGLAILAMLVPPVRRAVVRWLDAVRHPSGRAAALTSLAVAGIASAYLYFTAVGQGFGFYPKVHDEFMYLTQASLLARGRLWMPRLPLPEFFDSFYILVDPVYAPLSWPGTALLLVPAHWLHLPYWLTPLLAAGAVVGLLYLIVTELFDGVAGLLAALLLLGVSAFRWQALTAMSHVPVLLLGLALTRAWLKWRDGMRPRWAWAIGALAGWAAITRPIDAICVALPIGIAMVMAAWRSRGHALIPSSGTPGEGKGGGLRAVAHQHSDPLPNPPPEYRGREQERARFDQPTLLRNGTASATTPASIAIMWTPTGSPAAAGSGIATICRKASGSSWRSMPRQARASRRLTMLEWPMPWPRRG